MDSFEHQSKHHIVMSEVMTPDKANFSGHIHGGHLMQLLDKVAYACAVRYSGHYAVTLSADHILFKQPIFVGELVLFYASINYVGTSSMEVGIKVVAEELMSGKRRHTNTCYLTMIAVDDHGKPVKITPLDPKTEREKYRFEEAQLRRKLSKEYRDKHSAHKSRIRSNTTR